jgi:hypothetical protein
MPVGFEGAPEGSSWLEGVDSRLTDRLGTSRAKTFGGGGDGDSPRRDFGELVRLLVVPAGYVVKLEAIELVLEGSYGIPVCIHFVVVTTRILHDLIDHELRVPPNVEVFDACLNGDSEAAKKGLVLRHVVRHREV